ncbi:hypothetical protein [Okeania sp. SIO1I7]|uniref:hypothetical protein n=1 Tax=Okeania sp. SIO1I7 TaxID=2607772 RepID=UPI0013F7F4A9|nr:hypothetical protein [Okeania sp. SIO1I7]NET28151.1 hypothetical protein [Okeania sp. SIO1I7]
MMIHNISKMFVLIVQHQPDRCYMYSEEYFIHYLPKIIVFIGNYQMYGMKL